MSYTPINWQTGDTITAEKLNRCDNGWSVETSSTVLCSETVTTAEDNGYIDGSMAYSTLITADTIVVTFNGTEYECSKFADGPINYYGGYSGNVPDYSEYPFGIESSDVFGNFFLTETAGTYTISIAVPSETVETSSDFDSAVAKAAADTLPFKVVLGTTTWQEAYDAWTAGRMVYAVLSGGIKLVVSFNVSSYTITSIIYSNGSLTTGTYYTDDGTASGVIVDQ